MKTKRYTDPRIKDAGDALLKYINFALDVASGNNQELRFKINRWVYSRLKHIERRGKGPLKKHLFNSGMTACQGCGELFSTLKDIELHRKDSSKGYSADNCILLCRPCHRKCVHDN
ncbi:MAG: HNH endonuclease signature motif containing protein [Nitrospirota bacterium]